VKVAYSRQNYSAGILESIVYLAVERTPILLEKLEQSCPQSLVCVHEQKILMSDPSAAFIPILRHLFVAYVQTISGSLYHLL
jgi:hypothetical protein